MKMHALHRSSNPGKEQVKKMFNDIAARYDFMNHLLSLGIDILWRKKAARILKRHLLKCSNPQILDVATGTGDLIFELDKNFKASFIGLDISESMLAIAKKKHNKKNRQGVIHFQSGDAENIDFQSEKFHAVTCAFGVRNFQNLQLALKEFYRVLKKEHPVLIIEFCWKNKKLLTLIMRVMIRFLGKISDRKAYRYLPNSVENFYTCKEFKILLENVGFKKIHTCSLFFGIAAIYLANK